MLGYSQFQFALLSEHRGVEEVLFDLWQKDVKTKWEQVKAEREYGRSNLSSFEMLPMLSNKWVPSQFAPDNFFRVTNQALMKQTLKAILEMANFGWQYRKDYMQIWFPLSYTILQHHARCSAS